MSQIWDDLDILVDTDSATFYELPFFKQSEQEWVIMSRWKDDPNPIQRKTIIDESLVTVVISYPEIMETLEHMDLESELIQFINEELRSPVELEPQKQLHKAAFIVFTDRTEPLKKIGVVLEASNVVIDYTYNHDHCPIATIGHINFDRYKKLKKKKTETWHSKLEYMCEGTGNIGHVIKSDEYKILVKKSKQGIEYDFLIARQKYVEMKHKLQVEKLKKKIKKMEESKKKMTETIQAQEENYRKTVMTICNDLGYDGSKFLHTRYKHRKFRRIACGFSDNLYTELKKFCKDQNISETRWKRRGRYYTLEPTLVELGRIIGICFVSISYGAFTLYMNKRKLIYNQNTHKFMLIFTRQRQQINSFGQSAHV